MSFLRRNHTKDKLQKDLLNYLRKKIFVDFPMVKNYVDTGLYFYKEIQFYNLQLICWNNLIEKKLEIIIKNWIDISNFEKKSKKYYKNKECSICLEPLYNTDARTLNCGHDFHFGCLFPKYILLLGRTVADWLICAFIPK